MTEQPTQKKGFSSRLMGMKFMQRAAERKHKRKAEVLAAAPSDANIAADSVTAPTTAPKTAADDGDVAASSECIIVAAKGSKCRIVMDHSGADDVVYGRRSFSRFNAELEKAQGQPGEDGEPAVEGDKEAAAPATEVDQQPAASVDVQAKAQQQGHGARQVNGSIPGARSALQHLLKRRKKLQEQGMPA